MNESSIIQGKLCPVYSRFTISLPATGSSTQKKKEIAELSALSLASAIDAATASPPRAAHRIPPYHNHQTPQVSTSLSFPNSLKNLSFRSAKTTRVEKPSVKFIIHGGLI